MEKWKVYSNFINGEKHYIVGRRLSLDEPLHSGNVEYSGGYTTDRAEAENLADKLNSETE